MREFLLLFLARLPLAMLHSAGWVSGQLLWLMRTKPARIALRNLEVCLPQLSDTKRRQLARHSLIATAYTLLESFRLWHGRADRAIKLVRRVEGEPALRTALARQQGVILLVPHLGNWEMVGLYCSRHYPMTSLYRTQRSPWFDDFILRGRQRFGAELVTTTSRGVRAAVRALKQQRILGILPDQNPGAGAGVSVPFFGIRTNTPVLPVRLAHQHQTPVLCAWAERLPRARGFVLHFEPLDNAIAGPDPEQAAALMNRELERIIRHKPEQYWWSHPRFRHRPEGEEPIY
ncbi:lysophospholipid acyltransferase family protein [Thiohalophilus sp.]|uniref:lysophospholipid acyltransferase family protein n=1 Tax=Thiohalophilus sp. TaxID=3028392 RepID=UPI0039763FF5